MSWKGILSGVSVCLALGVSSSWSAEPLPMATGSPYRSIYVGPSTLRTDLPPHMVPMFGWPASPSIVADGAPSEPGKLGNLEKPEELPAPRPNEPSKTDKPGEPGLLPCAGCEPIPYAGPFGGSEGTCGPDGPTGQPPTMIGSVIPYAATQIIQIRNLATGVTEALPVAGMPVPGRGPFRVSENESPQPQDRCFLTYSYFHNVNKAALERLPENTTVVQRHLITNMDVHYETFGFEKAFCCNNFSIGVRVPFFQLMQKEGTVQEQGGFLVTRSMDDSTIGDVTVLLKAVVAFDPRNGSLLSTGVAVTAPTGPAIEAWTVDLPPDFQVPSRIRSTIFQPFIGYFLDCGWAFVHGFTSTAFPTEGGDVSILFNDIGVGCNLWGFLVPTFEIHFTTPMNHKEGLFREPVGVASSIVLTGGVHIAFWDANTVTFGLSTPVTGPGIYDIQGVAQLNLRF